ncbi:hypothetical protein OC846_000535 [Tilletia horrida]|uniref:Uncharacterized protein n=1 Tax=Tilletia horrida TaxID=155126 RepID=A0AAN6JTS8_9BASI|nr:hypothetical protein OC846_000535 [Tilletia horrida]
MFSALGSKATKACSYNFGVTDVKSFVATAQLLEGVGVSAYLGAAASITNPAYLTAAGSILTTEARHESWVNSIPLLDDAFPKPFDTPLNFNQTFSLAAPLIKNCPSTNPKLPVVAFPKLALKPSVPRGGATVTVTADKLSSGKYLAFLSGLQTYYAPVVNGKATVPQEVGYGRIYAVLVKSKKVTDDTTVAGPFAWDIPHKI